MPAVVTSQAGSAAEPQGIAIVHADQRSVGKLTAGNTRRVEPCAKCQCQGKENVASSHSPPFFRGRKVREKDGVWEFATLSFPCY
jgi:hypothetical protein